jgi:outer membrane receptor protein involved in Fe transport
MAPRMRSILFTSLFLAAPAFAEAPEIVVTGRGLAAPLGDAAYDVVTIDRERLTGSASGRLEDILRDAAGFQQFRRSDARSAQPTSQGATLRGLGGNASSRALILLDGVPQVDPFGGWVSWPAFEPMRLGMVRVTRGGGSGVNGPGAIAGTIELMSAGPADLSTVWGGVAYGSRDSVDADVGVSAPLGGGFGSISGGYSRGDGFIPIVREDRGPIDGPSPYEQASVAARAVVPIGGETELQASMLGMVDKRTRGVPFTPNENRGADASLRLVGRGDWGWEAVTWLQVREFSSGFSSINATRSTSTATLDQYNVPATGIGARAEIRPPLGQGIELRLGADARQTQGQTKELYTYVAGLPTRRREAGGETRTLGAFADASLELSPALTLTGGGRIDRWWIQDGFLRETTLATQAPVTNAAFVDRQGWEPTGRAGIAFKPVGAVTMRAAGYLGWRLPTLNELYRPFRVGADATGANAALEPERLKGIDAGIDFRPIPTVKLGATVFYNRLEDAIANVTLGTGPGNFPGVGFVAAGGAFRQRQNLSAIRSRGAELDAAVNVAAWRLSASYAYVDARVRAGGAAATLDGLRPAQTPKHQASATIGYGRSQAAQGSLTVRYVADQFEDDQNARVLDDAVTLDAAFVVPLAGGFSVEARAENLANARVEAGISGADIVERATPRTLWIGLRYGAR